LAIRLAQEGAYRDKKLLLLDKSLKNKNDRTWSFWSKNEDFFSNIIYHRWPSIRFASHNQNKRLHADPYEYCMIRGIDFYTYALEIIDQSPNIHILHQNVLDITESQEMVIVTTDQNTFSAPTIFNNIPQSIAAAQDIKDKGHHFVWQHFKGWFIETPYEAFDTDEAIIMDFRITQNNETRFFYVLPTTPKKALIELAIFSAEIPSPEFYDPFLHDYINKILGLSSYKILEEEVGAIPMTTFDFQINRTKRIIPIGTNGGSVKPSSGYAFTRIQKHMSDLTDYIIKGRLDEYKPKKSRYTLYDRTMLNAILSGKTSGVKVFDNLFGKLDAKTIFQFLDEEGSFINDLKIFSAPPKWPFIKAFLQEL